MPTYRITNRITGECHTIDAPYAQDACAALGWLIGNCHVQLIRESPYTDPARYAQARAEAQARRSARHEADSRPL